MKKKKFLKKITRVNARDYEDRLAQLQSRHCEVVEVSFITRMRTGNAAGKLGALVVIKYLEPTSQPAAVRQSWFRQVQPTPFYPASAPGGTNWRFKGVRV